MRAADSALSDLHATFGFVRLHLLGLVAPPLAIGLLLSGKWLMGITLTAAWVAVWIELAEEYGYEQPLLSTISAWCATVATLLFAWASILWWRAYLGHQPWSFP